MTIILAFASVAGTGTIVGVKMWKKIYQPKKEKEAHAEINETPDAEPKTVE